MKHNMKNKGKISSFYLKQQFISLLSNEFEQCGFDIVLRFESSIKKTICAIKFVNNYQVEIYINLGYVKKAINVLGCALSLKMRYCALFVAEYIKQIEQAKRDIPQNYFEGLVYLNAIDVCKTPNIVNIYSPLSCWYKNPKRTYCIRPIEISSAINALTKLRSFVQSEQNEQEAEAVKSLSDSLQLYSRLPEIAYIYENVPVYTLFDSFKRLAKLIAKEPEVVQEFPVLTLVSFGQIEQLTVRSLFLSCIQSNNNFLLGVALRLIVFLHLPYEIEFDSSCFPKLMDVMNLYIDNSLIYCNELSKSGGAFMKNNLFAIRVVIKSINRYFTMHGIDASAGNIHFVD